MCSLESPWPSISMCPLSPVRSNNLIDLPDELEELRYIRILRVKYNQLKRLPAVVRSYEIIY